MTAGLKERLSRYALTGVWNTAFGYGVFALLMAGFADRIHYLVIAAVSQVAAITNAYAVHKLLVFRTEGNYLQEYLRYWMVYGTTGVIGLAALAMAVNGLGLNVYLAQALVLAVQVFLSFAGHWKFSFSPSRRA